MKIFFNLSGIAGAGNIIVKEIPAAAGIGCSNQHKIGGEDRGPTRPGNGDLPVFKGLSKRLNYIVFKFYKLIEEKNTIVCI